MQRVLKPAIQLACVAIALFVFQGSVVADSISGSVVDSSGAPLEGVMVSAIDTDQKSFRKNPEAFLRRKVISGIRFK